MQLGEILFDEMKLPGGSKTAVPEALSVKVGITDGLASEIIDGVSEGDVLLTSAILPGASGGSATASPFGGGRRGFP